MFHLKEQDCCRRLHGSSDPGRWTQSWAVGMCRSVASLSSPGASGWVWRVRSQERLHMPSQCRRDSFPLAHKLYIPWKFCFYCQAPVRPSHSLCQYLVPECISPHSQRRPRLSWFTPKAACLELCSQPSALWAQTRTQPPSRPCIWKHLLLDPRFLVPVHRTGPAVRCLL